MNSKINNNKIINFSLSIISLIIIQSYHSSAQKLWGMTTFGGKTGYGVIFEYNVSTGIYYDRTDFTGAANGANPEGSLIQAKDGNLYGLAPNGGAYGLGVIFEYNLSSYTFKKLFDFNGILGAHPYGNLIQASDGNLYGMTEQGGTNSYEGSNQAGVIFQFNLSTNKYTKLIDFAGPNGAFPYGSLMQASDGNLYGMTFYGGDFDNGVLFEYNITTKTFTKLLDFTGQYGSYPGEAPYGRLIQANNGNLYGMTQIGGVNNLGVIFEYTLGGSYTDKIEFSGTSGSYPGGDPRGSLTLASDGSLWGLTCYGGANNLGEIFQYNPDSNTFKDKMDFYKNGDGICPNGEWPYGSLMQASNGKFYGMTYDGGTGGPSPYYDGVLFQYSPKDSNITTEIIFTGTGSSGANPIFSALIEVSCKQASLLDTIPNQSICQGNNISFTVNATGTELSYQWIKGDTNITGATNSQLTINNVQLSDQAEYSCNVSNNCSKIQLPKFTLEVNLAPISNTIFINQIKNSGDSVSYTLSPGGAGPFTYQWKLNGLNLAGATSSGFVVRSIQCSDTGMYSCRISNKCDSMIVKAAQLFITGCSQIRFAISGQVKYDNKDSTVMTNTIVALYNSNDTIAATSSTDANGYYAFVDLVNGNYNLKCSTTKAWGGSNPTDALIANKNYIGLYPITDQLKRQAADLNKDSKIGPTDALMINRRYIGILKKFKIDDWQFEQIKITINGRNITKNIRAICAGDVDASYKP